MPSKKEPPATPLLERASEFQRALLAWFEASQRKLPWRDMPTLYKTVVSEFMLQQTQVETVRPYFERWVARWPDFAALAAAPESEVVRAWEGLGYYTRARNLHRLAGRLTAGGETPRTAADWRNLPGVGPYTAAAIASIACGEVIAVVDGNVVRVLSRLVPDLRVFRDNGAAVKAFAELAGNLVNHEFPGAHNQAMMELGAMVCHRRKPLCALCPVRIFCRAVDGEPEAHPRFLPRNVERVSEIRLWVFHDGRVLLKRYASGAKRLPGLHELPRREDLNTALKGTFLMRKHRAISNQRIEEAIYRIDWTEVLEKQIACAGNLCWVALEDLPTITLSGPHRKWMATLLEQSRKNP